MSLLAKVCTILALASMASLSAAKDFSPIEAAAKEGELKREIAGLEEDMKEYDEKFKDQDALEAATVMRKKEKEEQALEEDLHVAAAALDTHIASMNSEMALMDATDKAVQSTKANLAQFGSSGVELQDKVLAELSSRMTSAAAAYAAMKDGFDHFSQQVEEQANVDRYLGKQVSKEWTVAVQLASQVVQGHLVHLGSVLSEGRAEADAAALKVAIEANKVAARIAQANAIAALKSVQDEVAAQGAEAAVAAQDAQEDDGQEDVQAAERSAQQSVMEDLEELGTAQFQAAHTVDDAQHKLDMQDEVERQQKTLQLYAKLKDSVAKSRAAVTASKVSGQGATDAASKMEAAAGMVDAQLLLLHSQFALMEATGTAALKAHTGRQSSEADQMIGMQVQQQVVDTQAAYDALKAAADALNEEALSSLSGQDENNIKHWAIAVNAARGLVDSNAAVLEVKLSPSHYAAELSPSMVSEVAADAVAADGQSTESEVMDAAKAVATQLKSMDSHSAPLKASAEHALQIRAETDEATRAVVDASKDHLKELTDALKLATDRASTMKAITALRDAQLSSQVAVDESIQKAMEDRGVARTEFSTEVTAASAAYGALKDSVDFFSKQVTNIDAAAAPKWENAVAELQGLVGEHVKHLGQYVMEMVGSNNMDTALMSRAVASRDGATKKLFETFRVCGQCSSWQRFGEATDGGYVMCMDGLKTGDVRAAYSLGVEHHDKWSEDVIKTLGVPVNQLDCTVDSSDCKACTFYKKCVVADGRNTVLAAAGEQNTGSTSQLHEADGWSLKETLANTGQGNAPVGSLLLKMDIESSEWPLYTSAEHKEELSKFGQIIVEFHGLGDEGRHPEYLKAMQNILDSGFKVAHLHGNNFQSMYQIGTQQLPKVVEVTFVRGAARPNGCLAQDYNSLDAANDPQSPELPLAHM